MLFKIQKYSMYFANVLFSCFISSCVRPVLTISQIVGLAGWCLAAGVGMSLVYAPHDTVSHDGREWNLPTTFVGTCVSLGYICLSL